MSSLKNFLLVRTRGSERREYTYMAHAERDQLRLRANKLPSPNHCESRDSCLVFKNLSLSLSHTQGFISFTERKECAANDRRPPTLGRLPLEHTLEFHREFTVVFPPTADPPPHRPHELRQESAPRKPGEFSPPGLRTVRARLQGCGCIRQRLPSWPGGREHGSGHWLVRVRGKGEEARAVRVRGCSSLGAPCLMCVILIGEDCEER